MFHWLPLSSAFYILENIFVRGCTPLVHNEGLFDLVSVDLTGYCILCTVSTHDASHDDGWGQRQCHAALDDDDDGGRRLAERWNDEYDVTNDGHGRWQRHVDENDADDDDE